MVVMVGDEKKIASLYRDAEKALKIVERVQGELHIPSINQLRYAGFHISQYLSDKSKDDELVKAVNHCKRAIYDAYETSIFYYLNKFYIFEEDYKTVVLIDIIPDWIELRNKIQEVKLFIAKRENSDDKKEDYYSDSQGYFEFLFITIERLESSRSELNKILRRQRNQYIISILAIIIAVIIGICTMFYNK